MRRMLLHLRRWRRGHVYGWRPPGWWPERLGTWAAGPRHPHDGKHVVIFVGAERFEFAPAALGRYRGHVYHGTLRPDEADLAERLVRLGLDPAPARTLAIISGFEGGFDAIQTYDWSKFSWGFIQFAATGGLPRLLHAIKTHAPAAFDACFGTAGIDARPDHLIVRVAGRTLEGRAARNRLHDDPALWTAFLSASARQDVQDLQVRAAYEFYYRQALNGIVTIGGRDVTLEALFAGNDFAQAMVCDRAINRGVGHAVGLFRRAAREVRASGPDAADAVLERARVLDRRDRRRLDALAEHLARPGAPPARP